MRRVAPDALVRAGRRSASAHARQRDAVAVRLVGERLPPRAYLEIHAAQLPLATERSPHLAVQEAVDYRDARPLSE